MKLACIDIGTNTALLLILDELLRDVVDVSTIIRLGEGLAATGRIADGAVERAVATLKRYIAECRQRGATIACCYGTAAFREASNAADIVGRISRETGLAVRVLSAREEAYYAYLSVLPDLPEGVESFAVVDIGGGSTEVIHGTTGAFGPYRSLPVGIVKLAERYIRHDPPLEEELEAVAGEARQRVSASGMHEAAFLIAIGGTMTTLAAIALNLPQFDKAEIEGFRFSRDEIGRWVGKLAPMTREERQLLSGMEAGREDVLLPGVMLMQEVMVYLKARSVTVSTKGGRYGLLYETAYRGPKGRGA